MSEGRTEYGRRKREKDKKKEKGKEKKNAPWQVTLIFMQVNNLQKLYTLVIALIRIRLKRSRREKSIV